MDKSNLKSNLLDILNATGLDEMDHKLADAVMAVIEEHDKWKQSFNPISYADKIKEIFGVRPSSVLPKGTVTWEDAFGSPPILMSENEFEKAVMNEPHPDIDEYGRNLINPGSHGLKENEYEFIYAGDHWMACHIYSGREFRLNMFSNHEMGIFIKSLNESQGKSLAYVDLPDHIDTLPDLIEYTHDYGFAMIDPDKKWKSCSFRIVSNDGKSFHDPFLIRLDNVISSKITLMNGSGNLYPIYVDHTHAVMFGGLYHVSRKEFSRSLLAYVMPPFGYSAAAYDLTAFRLQILIDNANS